MKKIIALILGITLVYSCSTSSNGNGNTNTTVVPVPPSNLTGAVASTTQINLSWTDNSTNETGFKIERKTSSGTYAVIGTTATDVATFNDTGITPNTTYIYRVYSNNNVGNSLTYSNELILTTTGTLVTDINGNTYPLIVICNQTWTKTNLNVTKYRNGDVIPQVTNTTQWATLTTGAWCYYNNTSSNGTTYGKLYNWYAVNDLRGLAPAGYHIPTDGEWTTLTTCLGGESVGGGAMKESGTIHWVSPNTGATNSSGFSGLPGGSRGSDGTYPTNFPTIGGHGNWWSSSQNSTSFAKSRGLNYNLGSTSNCNCSKNFGFSVRCIKD